ncbi:FCS-Like zinc finger 10 [Citrus sinensis]|uniref:FCS-Like zinc finger 10 n=1 Tax=Citrus sinensis TaxID=2711 RepID=A0ACB8J9E8_CITSI|nr:FCS-Like zinc finger 10 [Citrus sinensis]
MADSASEFSIQSDSFGIRQISSSLSGFLVGLSSKGSSDSDTVWSPTSPLDFRAFVNLSNPFSVKSPRSPPQNGYQKKWDSSEVGLGIINSLAEEKESTSAVCNSLKRKNIVFGSQVKNNIPYSSRHFYESVSSFMKSNSLPRNYMISQLPQTKNPKFPFDSSNSVVGNTEFPSQSGSFSSSLTSSAQNQDLRSKMFYSADSTITLSAPLVIDRDLLVKTSSLPIPIGSGHGHADCQAHELTNFDKQIEQEVELTQVSERPNDLSHYSSDEFLSFCYSCKKKLEKGEDIYMYGFVSNIFFHICFSHTNSSTSTDAVWFFFSPLLAEVRKHFAVLIAALMRFLLRRKWAKHMNPPKALVNQVTMKISSCWVCLPHNQLSLLPMLACPLVMKLSPSAHI